MEGRFSGFPSQHRFINCFQRAGDFFSPSTSSGRWCLSTIQKKTSFGPLNSANACRPYHISHSIMPKLYMSALLSYTSEWNTSGAMYTGVPAKVPVMSFTSLETPTSVILTEFSSDSLNEKKETHAVLLLVANSTFFYKELLQTVDSCSILSASNRMASPLSVVLVTANIISYAETKCPSAHVCVLLCTLNKT